MLHKTCRTVFPILSALLIAALPVIAHGGTPAGAQDGPKRISSFGKYQGANWLSSWSGRVWSICCSFP